MSVKLSCAGGCFILFIRVFMFLIFGFLVYKGIMWGLPPIKEELMEVRYEYNLSPEERTKAALTLEDLCSQYEYATGFTKDSIAIVLKHEYKYWDISTSSLKVRSTLNAVREGKK